MRHTLAILTLLCAAASPLGALAQDMPAPMPRPLRALGLIPAGTEQMFQATSMLDLSRRPSPDEINAAANVTTFSIPPSSGFCISALVSGGDPAIVLFNGADQDTGEGLFNADSGDDGLSSAEGRRSFVRTLGPVPDANFQLTTFVAQNAQVSGNTATIFVRVYPDTTLDTELDALCGPFREGATSTPMLPVAPPAAN